MFLCAIVLLCSTLFSEALDVISPAGNLTIVSGRTFTVEWLGSGTNTEFSIDLFHGESSSYESGCGVWVASLCPQGGSCMDETGDHDVIMPHPQPNVSEDGYVIGVKGVYDTEYGCSSSFRLITEEDIPDTNEYSLNVTSPVDGDVAIAGEQYTVEWEYLNGVGSSSDRFDIDLYSATGKSGQCGTYEEALCFKSTIGCRDSSGDYLITIPSDVTPGAYRIRVGRFDDESIYDCSGVFTVVDADSEVPVFSYSFMCMDDASHC